MSKKKRTWKDKIKGSRSVPVRIGRDALEVLRTGYGRYVIVNGDGETVRVNAYGKQIRAIYNDAGAAFDAATSRRLFIAFRQIDSVRVVDPRLVCEREAEMTPHERAREARRSYGYDPSRIEEESEI